MSRRCTLQTLVTPTQDSYFLEPRLGLVVLGPRGRELVFWQSEEIPDPSPNSRIWSFLSGIYRFPVRNSCVRIKTRGSFGPSSGVLVVIDGRRLGTRCPKTHSVRPVPSVGPYVISRTRVLSPGTPVPSTETSIVRHTETCLGRGETRSQRS